MQQRSAEEPETEKTAIKQVEQQTAEHEVDRVMVEDRDFDALVTTEHEKAVAKLQTEDEQKDVEGKAAKLKRIEGNQIRSRKGGSRNTFTTGRMLRRPSSGWRSMGNKASARSVRRSWLSSRRRTS